MSRLLIGLATLLLCWATTTHAQTVEYIHTDALGSVVAITDANRNVIERREYEPFGAQLTPAVSDGPGYTGHVQDAVTQLTYMQQRYYDSDLGRFLSVDPVTADIDTGANFSRYWYANNNPYRFTDPDGRQACGKNTTCRIENGERGGVIRLQSSTRSPLDSGSSPKSYSSENTPARPYTGPSDQGLEPLYPEAVILPAARLPSFLGKAKNLLRIGHGKGFFEGTQYTDKVLSQMSRKDFHGFPESVRAYQYLGSVSRVRGGDGVMREMLRIPGGYRGREGHFEFMKEPNGFINHRLFVPAK